MTFSPLHDRARPRHTSFHPGIGSWVVLSFGVALFFGGMIWFRVWGKQHADAVVSDAVMTEVDFPPEQAAPQERGREQTNIKNTAGETVAVGERWVEGGGFFHAVTAQLPEPPEGFVYTGWLVREGPFDFFLTGTFSKNEDGTWALKWQGTPGLDYADYPEVVVTMSRMGEEAMPGTPFARGNF